MKYQIQKGAIYDAPPPVKPYFKSEDTELQSAIKQLKPGDWFSVKPDEATGFKAGGRLRVVREAIKKAGRASDVIAYRDARQLVIVKCQDANEVSPAPAARAPSKATPIRRGGGD